jgi:hypothetical protein
MANEIIVNGTFAQGSLGWSGTDIETSYTETAYLGNGSTNNVAEIDGKRGQITRMEQSITVNSDVETALTFRTALRTASQNNAGTEGFRIEIRDAAGKVIASQTVTPTSQAWTAVSVPVTFPAAGTYTIRFTEVGIDDSLGAIVDDVSLLVCFAADCRIETETGLVRAGALTAGQRVWTRDAGLQPIRWVGRRRVTAAEMAADPRLRPIAFAPGSLGEGRPFRTMRLSPQHRLCIGNWKTDLYFAAREVLIPAVALVNGHSVRQVLPPGGVTYVHFLLDAHHVVCSDGALTESFLPAPGALRGVDAAARRELFALFPELARRDARHPLPARPILRVGEGRLVA